MNYEELVKALRCKRDDCDGCDIAFFDKDEGWMCRYAAKDDDAAAAIEALKAELEKKRTAYCWGCKCEKMEASDRLQKRGEPVLLAALPTASTWHRVEVEEPTKAGWYLIMDEDGDFNVDEWHNTFGWQFVTPSDADRITHWMPIEPPKEDA